MEFKPDMKVSINNLVGWNLYFRRISGVGDIKIPANIKNYGILTFEEIQMQIQTGNEMFVGDDGFGSHARLYIINDEIRSELLGTSINEVIEVLTLDTVKELLEIKQKAAFSKRLKELVTNEAEQRMVVELAKEAGAANTEAWKIEAIEKASGYSLTVSDDETPNAENE